MEISGKLNMKPLQTILAKRGLEERGRVQKFIDSEVLRLHAPYLPFQTGTLIKSGTIATAVGSGRVVYNAPYAKYLYNGKLMVGSTGSSWANKGERKILTGKDLNYNGAPKRGPRSFERMKADCGDDILNGAAKVAGGRAKK